MIQLLTQIETDDEYFPIQDVQLVCKIIDPYGIDEELTELCRKFILKQEQMEFDGGIKLRKSRLFPTKEAAEASLPKKTTPRSQWS